MLNDLSKSIKAQLYERVSSPLLASFVISWAIWNYRFILVLVSSMSAPEKFVYIDAQIFPTAQQVFFYGSLYPLITALVLIFIYPIPAKYVYRYWRKRQRDLKEIQQSIDDETPLTKEEARQIRQEALIASIEYDKVLQSRSAETARLKELIQELQNEKSNIHETDENPDNNRQTGSSRELDDEQMQMLERIAKSSSGVLQKLLIQNSKDNILAEYNIGELVNGEYVSKTVDRENRDYRIKATHKGRATIVNNRS